MSIHNYELMYQTAKENVRKAEFSERNKELIIGFASDRLLEGISKPRSVRYLSALKLLATQLGTDFDKATKDDIKRLVGFIQERPYTPWTKRCYKLILRQFYKWLEGSEQYPEIVSWIPIKMSRCEVSLPSEGDLLSEEDVQKLLQAAEHPRDKAFVSMLWESGGRIGEVGNLKIKNALFDSYGTIITVQGKTGSRKIRLIASTPYLAAWLNAHPTKAGESPLWINIGTRNHNNAMAYITLRVLLQRLFQKAGIKKRYNPHLFRHSRATFMAHHLTEFQMNQYFGWVQGSGMPATYVHMSGRDVDTAILRMNGMKTEESKDESKILPKKCPRCDIINAYESKHCSKCGGILDLKYAMELEEKRKEQEEVRSNADTLMNLLMKDPDVQKVLMEKIALLKS